MQVSLFREIKKKKNILIRLNNGKIAKKLNYTKKKTISIHFNNLGIIINIKNIIGHKRIICHFNFFTFFRLISNENFDVFINNFRRTKLINIIRLKHL